MYIYSKVARQHFVIVFCTFPSKLPANLSHKKSDHSSWSVWFSRVIVQAGMLGIKVSVESCDVGKRQRRCRSVYRLILKWNWRSCKKGQDGRRLAAMFPKQAAHDGGSEVELTRIWSQCVKQFFSLLIFLNMFKPIPQIVGYHWSLPPSPEKISTEVDV